MRIRTTLCRQLVLAVGLLIPLFSFSAMAQKPPETLPLDSTLDQAIAAAKKAGFPVTPQELQRPLPPQDQNAAPLYLQWHDLRKDKRISYDDETTLIALRSPKATTEQIAAARRLVDAKKDVFALIHQAASRPQCVFQKDYTLGPALLYPELSDMRCMARYLRGESDLLLHEGKPEEAARTLGLSFHIVGHLLQGQSMTSHEVALAFDGFMLNGLESLLNAYGDRASVREAILQVLNERPTPPSPAVTLHNTIAASLAAAEMFRWSEAKLRSHISLLPGITLEEANLIDFLRSCSILEDVPSIAQYDELKPIRIPVVNIVPDRKDHTAYTAWIDDNKRMAVVILYQMLTELDRPYDEAMGNATGMLLGLGITTAKEVAEKGAEPSSNAIAGLYAENVYEFLRERRSDQEKARGEILRAATLLLNYKAAHGSFPTKLDDTLSSLPTDPFDGKPLKYRREGDGFVLYAIGKNHSFDGGKANSLIPDTEAGLRYPLPTMPH